MIYCQKELLTWLEILQIASLYSINFAINSKKIPNYRALLLLSLFNKHS